MVIKGGCATVTSVKNTNVTSRGTRTDRDEVFILRMWRERNDPGGKYIWRGHVKHQRSGIEESFQGLEKALKVLASLVRSLTEAK
jgi:hypothetical protein